MIIKNNNINNEIHLGINNKYFELLFIHPWKIFLISYLFISVLIYFSSNIDKVKHFSLIALPVCIISLFIAMIYHKNSCYKLVINTVTKKVSIYLMFTGNRVVEDSDRISVDIGREIKLSTTENKYKIFSNILHDVVSYLPPNTKISFNGIFGKHFEEELKLLNKPLTPGKFF